MVAENRSTEQAARWYRAFDLGIDRVSKAPKSCPESPENAVFPYEIREFYFGAGSRPTHRVVFTVRKGAIVILAIRHLAQREMQSDEI